MLNGCATTKVDKANSQKPTKIMTTEKNNFPIPPYAKYLKDKKICLDPGHGGDGHIPGYKAGPTGVREAEVNLRVALQLKSWLEECGAKVYMTRTTDIAVSLNQRTEYANSCGADYFLSMHHNAISNPSTNFTSTWYHAEVDYSHLCLDMARYIQDGVADALGLEQRAMVPLKSDYYVYPDAGFAVLRNTRIPAVLCEASFHSNPEEEQRINNPEYNKREAYGYFIGLAKFFYSGVPRYEVLSPSKSIKNRTPEITVKINDGLNSRLILEDSLKLKLDGEDIPYLYDRSSGTVNSLITKPLQNNYHSIEVLYMNLNKTSAYPDKFVFQVVPEVHTISMDVSPFVLPNDGQAIAGIKLTVKDDENNPVADGTPIELASQQMRFSSSTVYTLNGEALAYVIASQDTGVFTITAHNQQASCVAQIRVATSTKGYLTGSVFDQKTGLPVVGAKVVPLYLVENPGVETFSDGIFIMGGLDAKKQLIQIQADGYETLNYEADLLPNQSQNLRFELIRKQ